MCGILNVVEAMALAAARIPDAVLLLLGDKPNRDYERQIFERIDALGLRDRIVWLNGVDRSDMPEIYRLANVTVSVATSDGVSLSVLESMAVKTPVVLGDIPNYNGIFEHRKHCLMVDPTAPDRIADGIVDALTDDALRASLTEEAHRKVERDGNLDTEASRIEQMLLHLAGRRGRRLYLGSRVRHVARLVRLGLERRTRR